MTHSSTALRGTGTVPRELVHRTLSSNVLLTGWWRTGDAAFTVAARWPAGDRFFAPVAGRHSPVMLVETVRQASILLAHAEYDVPLEHHFVMWDVSMTSHPDHLLATGEDTEVELDVTFTDLLMRGRKLAGMHAHLVLRIGGTVVATCGGRLGITAPAVYRRLRGERINRQLSFAAAPLDPKLVDRSDPQDVVLAAGGGDGAWQLRADGANRSLFDHPGDHFPGMVLLEAVCQAARAETGPGFYPLGLEVLFQQYVEFDAPCVLEVRRLPADAQGNTAVHVVGRQDEKSVFMAMVDGRMLGAAESPSGA
ncbi:ScbA/BarX family gamma-butyrolactone biosynthesis protein [Kitasatospora sp. NPDC093558]|uniref:ScbA/BarX family gamma-butyrolactone biosynthesis protein n=1 Tax=Kitasatospora sp. NPDC093558 TaxID=3155201 RepID=UPI00341CB9D4